MIALTVPPPILQPVASPALPVRRVRGADRSNWTNAQGTGDATSASTRHSASDGIGDSYRHLHKIVIGNSLRLIDALKMLAELFDPPFGACAATIGLHNVVEVLEWRRYEVDDSRASQIDLEQIAFECTSMRMHEVCWERECFTRWNVDGNNGFAALAIRHDRMAGV
jgi:hypothetical protein